MEELLSQSKEVLGALIALAVAVGASALPVSKWVYRRHKAVRELEALQNQNQNQNTTTISMGGDPVHLQLQRMEQSIEHIETMLVLEGQVHHTQTSHLDGLRGEVAKLRDEIIELRIRTGGYK